MEVNEGTYKQNVLCVNCDWKGSVDIPKGQVAEEIICPTCGNGTLRKDRSGGDMTSYR